MNVVDLALRMIIRVHSCVKAFWANWASQTDTLEAAVVLRGSCFVWYLEGRGT